MPKVVFFHPSQPKNIPLPSPDTKVTIRAPGPAPQKPKLHIARLLVTPLLMLGAYTLIVLLGIFRSEYLIFMFIMALIFPVQGVVDYWFQRQEYRKETTKREEANKKALEESRQQLEKMHNDVRRAALYTHPSQQDCLKIVSERTRSRLWARRPGADSFLRLRLGLGVLPFAYEILAPEQLSLVEPDKLLEEAREVAEKYAEISGMPMTLPLSQVSVGGIVGSPDEAFIIISSLVTQLTTHHAPHDVKLVLIYPKDQSNKWELFRWLPHVWSNDSAHRFLACDRDSAHKMLDAFLEEVKERQGLVAQDVDNHQIIFSPQFVFVFADEKLVKGHPIRGLLYTANPRLRTTTLVLTQRNDDLPPECQVTIRTVGNDKLTVDFRGAEPKKIDNRSDIIPETILEQLCRSLAPVHIKHDTIVAELPTKVPLFDALRIKDVQKMSLLRRWQRNDPYVSMAVPVGRRAGGQIQYLDLHERKGKPTLTSGHGPHGLIAGTTGSGKTELIQTLILSMAANFHPHEVVFAIVDFRPPAVDPIIYKLPHVVNVIDKSEQNYVPRALSSLEAELNRRMRMFRETGVNHVDDYMELYRQKDQRANQPMPYLIVIVDEFAELREKLPDEMARFETIARQGRAYGVRMLLATQKPAGKITGEVVSNVSLRLCLRVATPADSEDMVETDLASRLKYPGRTYFRLAGEEGTPLLFQSAYPAAPYAIEQDNISPARILLNGSREELHPSDNNVPVPTQRQRQIDVLVKHIAEESLRNHIPRLDGPWRSPLPPRLLLQVGEDRVVPKVENAGQEQNQFALMDDFYVDAGGWDGSNWHPITRWLAPLIGLCDDPDQQAQPPLRPNLGEQGHLLLICGTDRPTAVSRQVLRTIIFTLVQEHSPADLHLYCLDFGNNSLRLFEGLPHVGNIVRIGQTRLLKRLFVWILSEIELRKQFLVDKGFDSVLAARKNDTLDTPPAIVLVIDNLEAIRLDETRLSESEEQIINNLAKIATDGAAVGIHLIAAGSRNLTKSKGFDFRPILDRMQDMRLYVQLGQQNAREKQNDYAEIVDGIRKDLYIPFGIEGRGVFVDSSVLECQIAQIEITVDEISQLASEMQSEATRLDFSPVKKIGDLLPKKVELSKLLLLNGKEGKKISDLKLAPFSVPIGIADSTLEPIEINLDKDGPHFIVTGPRQAGKTSTLISWLTALAATHSSEEIQFVLFDTYRRSLAPIQDLPHVKHYVVLGNDDGNIETTVKEIGEILKTRREGNELINQPRIVVVCDDYVGDCDNTFRKFLKEHLLRDVSVGLHIILAHSTAERMATHYEDPRRQIVSSSPSGFLVGSKNVSDDAYLFDNIELPYHIEPRSLLPGQGYMFRHHQYELVQLAEIKKSDLEKLKRIIQDCSSSDNENDSE